MVYNFNLGIGWASSGVEYAQIYRARMFRNVGIKAKFIFTDMFPRDNIEEMTKNIGFEDDEVEWLYTAFTDTGISPVTFTLKDLEKTFAYDKYTFTRDGKMAKYVFDGTGVYYTVYMLNEKDNYVHRVEMVVNGFLIRKDYFTHCRIFSEYYAPLDNKAHLYQRRFFNRDGSTAYEEIIDDRSVVYRFQDRILGSKEELVGYFVTRLGLTDKDTVIIDRTTGIGQSIIQNAGNARVGIIIHADHFSENQTNEETILWNNYYEYAFSQNRHIAFYISSTEAQTKLLTEQFEKYMGVKPNALTIPVGSIPGLEIPEEPRKPYSLITASRLAGEKHIDWLVEAVVKARERIPKISLDIYGEGAEKDALKKRIEEHGAQDYIRLCGQQHLKDVYKRYEAYAAGSMSEGFGLTLLEAVGSGLPIIGFDVRYGNPTFIDDEKNGYLIPVHDEMEGLEKIDRLAECMVRLFSEADMESFHRRSYEIAKEYLTEKVENKWKDLLG